MKPIRKLHLMPPVLSGNVILSKRAKKYRKETGDPRYQCRADEERASLAVLMKTGVSRPLWFLISEPIGKTLLSPCL